MFKFNGDIEFPCQLYPSTNFQHLAENSLKEWREKTSRIQGRLNCLCVKPTSRLKENDD